MKKHKIVRIQPNSIAEEMDIEAGDHLLKINDRTMDDIFDYQYLCEDDYLEVLIEKPDGQQWLLEIDKDPDEDLGIEFDNGLMDNYRSCCNKCIFCFIDQMPPGMRETLYFKDDDSRLSFLQGNYVTLTNMSEHDIDRIITYNLSPINISFQTTNPELRCMMLNNRFAGKALQKVDRLFEAGITMNGQIVLCRDINDGEELKRTIADLMKYVPCLESVSVVPVGLSRYREGLYPLKPFDAGTAAETIDIIEGFQKKAFREHGLHFIHASDELYLLAGRELPEADRYDGYLQLENGVGMLRLLIDEFGEAAEELKNTIERNPDIARIDRDISIATGKLAAPFIREIAGRLEELLPGVHITVHEIRNDFFGEMITVAGLLTGQDIEAQLRGRELGERLVLPQCVLRAGEDVFLDDMRLADLEKSLQVPIDIVKSSGWDFVETVLGIKLTGDNI
jgi:putative radical SAM enzyme (TIGR03279 family)